MRGVMMMMMMMTMMQVEMVGMWMAVEMKL